VDGQKLKANMSNAYFNKEGVLVPGDIPAVAWKKDALGKNKPTAVSLEAKNDFLLEVLKRETERLKWVQGENSSAPATETPKNTVPTASPAQAFEPAAITKETPGFDPLPF
jgi:hypothetical protein